MFRLLSWEGNPAFFPRDQQGPTYKLRLLPLPITQGNRVWNLFKLSAPWALSSFLPTSISVIAVWFSSGWTTVQSRDKVPPQDLFLVVQNRQTVQPPLNHSGSGLSIGKWAVNWKTFSNASIHHIQTFELLMGCKWLPKSKSGQKQRRRQAETWKEGFGAFQMEFKTLFICRHPRFWEICYLLGPPSPECYVYIFCLAGDIMPQSTSIPHPCSLWVQSGRWTGLYGLRIT